ncbi:hypothetical protein D3C76_854040 [compost metagenome]
MGIPVPTWVRQLVWDMGQQSRFIAAVRPGADLGSYLTNEWCEYVGRAVAENGETLLAGQQRLHSLEEYFLDRLAVPDIQGQPRLWSELSNVERKRFLSTIFTHSVVNSDDEMALRRTMIFALSVGRLVRTISELFCSLGCSVAGACPFGDGCRKPSLVCRRSWPFGLPSSCSTTSRSARSACMIVWISSNHWA